MGDISTFIPFHSGPSRSLKVLSPSESPSKFEGKYFSKSAQPGLTAIRVRAAGSVEERRSLSQHHGLVVMLCIQCTVTPTDAAYEKNSAGTVLLYTAIVVTRRNVI